MSESLITKIQNYGFEIDRLELDGRVHRFRTTNKPKKKNGWYVGKTIMLRGERSMEVCTVGDWALGESKTFTSRDNLSEADQKAFSEASRKMTEEMNAMQALERDRAAKEAKLLWADGVLIKDIAEVFPYLNTKKIASSGAIHFVKMTKEKNGLMIPVYNREGEIRSAQVIDANGEKRFLTGGEIKGNFFPLRGGPPNRQADGCIVCEGFSTGASLYEALGKTHSVIIAFNSGNLFPVTAKMVLEYGADRVIVAADDDRYNGKNAGLFFADKCKELGVKVVAPDFTEFGYDSFPTDFNDLHCLGGLELIREQFGLSLPLSPQPKPAVSLKSDNAHQTSKSEAADLWPAKELGFYIMVPQKNGELKAVPRFHELSKYLSQVLNVRYSDAWVLVWDKTHFKNIDKTGLYGLIHKLTLDKIQPDHFEKFLKVIRAECIEGKKKYLSTEGLVNLRNGILNIKTKELLPHSPLYDFRYVLPYDYDSKAEAPEWQKFLNETFSGDEELVGLSSEIFGYTLAGGDPFLHKAFMLYGIGRNGKSVYLDILRAMLGESNCSSKSIESLHEKFARSALVGKIANISQETSKREVDSGVFKSIVAGDKIDASFKGKDEFDFTPTCRMFFSGNFFPTFKDSSAGMNDRLVIIPFERYIEEEERDFGIRARLLLELSGIFNWSLEGLSQLLERGNLRKVKSVEEIRDEYQIASCSVYGFMSTRCQYLNGNGPSFAWRKLSDFYKPYEEYCIEQKIQPKSKISFGMTLTNYLLKKFGRKGIRKDRQKFNETNKLAVLGQMSLVADPINAQIPTDALETKELRNYALEIPRYDDDPNSRRTLI